jgi:nitrogen fixation protein NifU and related proteins
MPCAILIPCRAGNPLSVTKNVFMHSQRLLDHFSNPRNAGELDSANLRVDVENPVCGDQLRLTLQVGETITDLRFLARGCTASIACASAITELLKGKTKADLATITPAAVEAAVGGLIPESKHAAALAADAARQIEKLWK